MFELQGKRVWVMRNLPEDGVEGTVERVSGKWIYLKVNDPTGTIVGVWINTDLQREIQVLHD